jgi:hypothetical protein
MRELDLKEMLLDDDVVTSYKPNVATSYKPVNRSSRSSKYGVASPSSEHSQPRSRSSEHSDQPRSRSSEHSDQSRSRSKSGESINEAISLSSDTSSGKRKIKKKTNKQSKRRRSRSPPNPPKYLYTLDMDKDLLNALRVNVVFSIIFFMVLIIY